MRPIIAASVLLVALILKVGYQHTFDLSEEGIPTKKSLKEFPWGLVGKGWSESRQPLEESIEQKAGISEYLNCTFTKVRQPSIWCYVGYYDGHSMESMHQPEICFPGSGWEAQNKRIENFNIEGIDNASFNLIEFKKSLGVKLTAYTFYYEGKFQPSQSYLESGRVFGERHFAIITAATNVQGSIDVAKNNLEELFSKFLPELIKHFPPPKKD